MNWTHRTLIVEAAHVELARTLAAAAADSGLGMFTTPLSATGAEPATHYISAGLIQQEFAYLLTSAEALYGAATTEFGLSDVDYAAVEAMLAASVIRADENPHEVLRELGLKLVHTDTGA